MSTHNATRPPGRPVKWYEDTDAHQELGALLRHLRDEQGLDVPAEVLHVIDEPWHFEHAYGSMLIQRAAEAAAENRIDGAMDGWAL